MIISILLYLHQSYILDEEKKSNAELLTKSLSGPAEYYLNRNKETSLDEKRRKYSFIVKEASNFKSYYSDISEIFIINHVGYSIPLTNKRSMWNYKQNPMLKVIKYCLKQKENNLWSSEKISPKKSKNENKKNFLAITYPVFLHSGSTNRILKDYKTYYKKYHNSKSVREKKWIYRVVSKNNKDILVDEKVKGKVILTKKSEKESKDIIKKDGDIDFLFHSLFTKELTNRNRKINSVLKRNQWLYYYKRKYLTAKKNDLLAEQNEMKNSISKNISKMAEQLEKSRRLGGIIIVFNIAKREKELSRLLSKIIIPLPFGYEKLEVKGLHFIFGLFILIAIAFTLVLNFMIKNLKKLENWAITVADGNLNNKIEINARDEIGRLGDVFNYMLDEIIIKYHLEKFVSTSAKSMITRKNTDTQSVDLGVTGRKNFAFIFSDVRGFTSFSEKNDPETVIQVLNYYLDLQSNIIKSSKGDIDDYVGDEIMCHFGGSKRANTAIDTAINIMKAIKKANIERDKNNEPIFEIGIGIHGGDVVVGNIGSKFRMDFACVGDAVNLTSRLCSAAGPGEIIVSQELFEKATKKYKTEEIPALTLKGKAKKISVIKILVS